MTIYESDTDDGGRITEYETRERDLSLVSPKEGNVTYFAAYAPGGFRRVGIVKNERGRAALIRWAAGDAFPASDLTLSTRGLVKAT